MRTCKHLEPTSETVQGMRVGLLAVRERQHFASKMTSLLTKTCISTSLSHSPARLQSREGAALSYPIYRDWLLATRLFACTPLQHKATGKFTKNDLCEKLYQKEAIISALFVCLLLWVSDIIMCSPCIALQNPVGVVCFRE